ncbi:MAG TPA: vitamin K epoxide reductase family protein [Polyangiaceae bacterium]|nr:vitamin K epoxide reductase family protein [Polyangiaceae bacterium]
MRELTCLGARSRFPWARPTEGVFMKSRGFAILALLGALLGLVFALTSTLDYASHLDRRLHDVTCSFIPGAAATGEAEACRTAMYSPYAALLRDSYWGGIPISLFAVGAFCFFAGFAIYLAVAGQAAPRRAVLLFAGTGVTPALVSIGMFVISATRLGTFCKTCVGIYIASFVLAVAALLGLATLSAKHATDRPRPPGSLWLVLALLPALAALTLLPAVVYASAAPDHRPYLASCGELKQQPREKDQLLSVRGQSAVKPALFFEDPLCPTCKAFHARLKGEGVLSRLDIKLALFPLDPSCNWMLDTPLHPGACTLSKAVICGGERSLEVLEWAYDEQERLGAAGKSGEDVLKGAITQRWGADMGKCVDSPKTKARLNAHLHFAVDNAVPVSTPQVYLDKKRICDEDTDIGLRYTLKHLAPEVIR